MKESELNGKSVMEICHACLRTNRPYAYYVRACKQNHIQPFPEMIYDAERDGMDLGFDYVSNDKQRTISNLGFDPDDGMTIDVQVEG